MSDERVNSDLYVEKTIHDTVHKSKSAWAQSATGKLVDPNVFVLTPKLTRHVREALRKLKLVPRLNGAQFFM